jgi:Family of unknown function (DUF6074)
MSSPAPIKPHDGWLKQVGLDLSLTAVAQVIAVVLADCADPGTDIARIGADALAAPTGMKAVQVREALMLLVDRGHLRSLSLRGNAEAFQFIRRRRPITRRAHVPKPPTQVFPFPPASQRGLVREIVGEMLIRPQQAAETWLQAELLKQRRSLRKKGFPQPVVIREIQTLEVAVRRGLWRAVLVPDEPA